MKKSICKIFVQFTLDDLLQAFACSMCKYGGDEPCEYLPESNKELCEHFEEEQEHE